MPDSAEAYAARIQAIAPDVVVDTAVFNGDGLVNDVAIVNDRLVLRFAKNEYSQRASGRAAGAARHPPAI